MDPSAEEPKLAEHLKSNSAPKDRGGAAEANARSLHQEQTKVDEEAPSTHTISAYDGTHEEPISVRNITVNPLLSYMTDRSTGGQQ
jgi:hypothetical protein